MHQACWHTLCKLNPIGRFPVCSAHFTEESFERFHVGTQGGLLRCLKVHAYPMIWRPKTITKYKFKAQSHRWLWYIIINKQTYNQVKYIHLFYCCHKNSWKLTQMLMFKSKTWRSIIAAKEKWRQFKCMVNGNHLYQPLNGNHSINL